MIISAIAAVSENGIIGHQGDLPWSLPDDMAWFQRHTKGHHVITGRKNYESIPPKYRPLKDRVNLVVSRNNAFEAPGATVVPSIEAALGIARAAGESEVFVIGGGQIYEEAFAKSLVERLYLTRVHSHLKGDTRFPEVAPAEWIELSRLAHPADERHAHAFSFVILERR
ncbi:MAG: dihydrofolate reductase [Flavobacteriales bacterium]|nr:dihydrofolate reductase [Flavobacteriales bacterium]